jgi:hypothetical protein
MYLPSLQALALLASALAMVEASQTSPVKLHPGEAVVLSIGSIYLILINGHQACVVWTSNAFVFDKINRPLSLLCVSIVRTTRQDTPELL